MTGRDRYNLDRGETTGAERGDLNPQRRTALRSDWTGAETVLESLRATVDLQCSFVRTQPSKSMKHKGSPSKQISNSP